MRLLKIFWFSFLLWSSHFPFHHSFLVFFIKWRRGKYSPLPLSASLPGHRQLQKIGKPVPTLCTHIYWCLGLFWKQLSTLSGSNWVCNARSLPARMRRQISSVGFGRNISYNCFRSSCIHSASSTPYPLEAPETTTRQVLKFGFLVFISLLEKAAGSLWKRLDKSAALVPYVSLQSGWSHPAVGQPPPQTKSFAGYMVWWNIQVPQKSSSMMHKMQHGNKKVPWQKCVVWQRGDLPTSFPSPLHAPAVSSTSSSCLLGNSKTWREALKQNIHVIYF